METFPFAPGDPLLAALRDNADSEAPRSLRALSRDLRVPYATLRRRLEALRRRGVVARAASRGGAVYAINRRGPRWSPEGARRFARGLAYKGGLVTAVAQDWLTGEVLMVAHMSPRAVERTLAGGRATYWSRSRKRLWMKGEESGHLQYVKGVRVDCDSDVLLLRVDQVGAACHTMNRTCFYREAGKVSGRRSS